MISKCDVKSNDTCQNCEYSKEPFDCRSKDGHTRGEWRVEADEDFDEIVAHPYEYDVIIAKVYGVPADLREGRFNGDPEANARLLAAAPDLLEACKETLTLLINTDINGEIWDQVIGNQDKGRIQSSIAILGAAIAKAEGH